MSGKIHLLIVEDHVALAKNLFEFFGEARYELDFASNGLTGLHLCESNSYDVLVLDVMLPGLSGFELCRRIREELRLSTPIILITAKDRLSDKEAGFTEGADDYLVKPFDLRELQLRVEALYRRHAAGNQLLLRAGAVSFNPGTLQVSIPGEAGLELSGAAAHIFEALMMGYPNYLSHEQLARQVWGEREADVHTLRTHIYGLRKQLQERFGMPLIKTVHGRGYRLIPPEGG